MSFSISKPPILKRADKLSRDPEVVHKSLQELRKQTAKSLVALGLDSRYVHEPEVIHLRDDVLDPTRGWWAGLGDIEAVARKALLKAGQLSLRYNLPSDSYWVAGGDKFEVVICKSDRQLTVFFISPFPPPGRRGRGRPPVPRKLQAPTNVYRFS